MFKKIKAKFFTPKGFDPVPYIVSRKRIYIFPTKTGFVFLFFLLAMFLASLNSSNNLGYLMTFSVVGMAVVSIFHTFKNLHQLQILLIDADPVFAGEAAKIRILLRGAKINNPNLKLVIVPEKEVLIDLLYFENQEVVIHSLMNDRGIQQIREIIISTTYPFGLLRAWTYFKPDFKIIVYPKPWSKVLNYNVFVPDHNSQGDAFGSSGTDDFNRLKEYQPGDALSLIHWKSLSKGQGMFTKEFTGASGGYFSFDFNQLPEMDLEARLSYLCALILQADKMKTDYALILPGLRQGRGRGFGHQQKCLELLARFGEGSA